MTPAVVVNTFDRPESLARLLRSLENCQADQGTDVIISIDGGGTRIEDTRRVIAGFTWPDGSTKVIEQDDLGLVRHFYACGDLVDEIGPMVMAEDDLVLGCHGLRFAGKALEFASGDERIAGVSLSTPVFDGFRHQVFEPLLDGSDAVLAKVPWFHGMAWTPAQWRAWRGGSDAPADVDLPPAFDELDGDEWFPGAVRSLVATDRWWLLARNAHAVNFGDAGVHFDEATSVFQRPLVGGSWREPVFLGLGDASVMPYDQYMEPDARWLAPRVAGLESLDVTFDLRGIRPPSSILTNYVVTSRRSSNPLAQWGAVMHPLEQNLLSQVPGESLTLSRLEDMATDRDSERAAEKTVLAHGRRAGAPGLRDALGAWVREHHLGRSK